MHSAGATAIEAKTVALVVIARNLIPGIDLMIDLDAECVQAEIWRACAQLRMIIEQLIELRVRDANTLDNVFSHRVPRRLGNDIVWKRIAHVSTIRGLRRDIARLKSELKNRAEKA